MYVAFHLCEKIPPMLRQEVVPNTSLLFRLSFKMDLFGAYLSSLALVASFVAGLPLETAPEARSISYAGYKSFRIDISIRVYV